MKAAAFDTGLRGLKKYLPNWLNASPSARIRISPVPEPVLISKKRVLIVDDDAVLRLATSSMLRNRGYDVVTAADGSEAIGAVAQGRPDVILLDLSFPPDVCFGGSVSWDGLRLMSWLRGLKNARGSKFIVITSSDSEQCRQRALASGAVGFFGKPINYERLAETIDQQLRCCSGESDIKTE